MLVLAALLAASAPQCTVSTAVRATVEEMAREPERWFDRCVRLNGYVSGYTFYSGPKGHYRRFASDKEDHPNDGWLGLYFEDRRESRKESGRASLIGVVDDCGRSYRAATATAKPGELIMMLGYCHYQGGLTLTRVRVISRDSEYVERQSGEAARVAFGDLELPDETHPIPSDVQAVVAQFEQAFAANDKRSLVEVAYPYLTTVETASQKRNYEAFLSGATGPLHIFRRSGKLPQPQWFYAREPKERQGDAPDWFACYCRDHSCAEKWPIAALDAVSSSDFPYACFRVSNWNQGGLKLSADLVEEPY